ncbi:hypothetical protein ONS95_000788 [Cadophora gregata]|uniref:uncharacterized protein n=1 Tax=Cadophora gregata TaxID=51156 RepID=UPI0026DBE673|nr:uncharacterized protein ONS95_000788 [Cadophora gregata]KAK0103029.1 hypothetical protein ONS96_005641 [Cadophora gregata f. sp. sojae]KAK0128840.1 hypothetical protein ONS95_000788 [Cadophora gregata]
MDILQEYALPVFQTLTTLEPYTRAPLRTLSNLYTQYSPLLTPYLDSALRTLHTSPAILSLAALLLLLIIALQILYFVRRVMMFWFRVVMKLVVWGCIGVLVAVVWQRGLERTVGDLVGWAGEVARVWEREYKRWEGVQNQAGGGNSGTGSGKGGYGRTNAGSSWR